MNHGEVHAWHYQRRRPVKVRWRDGVITSIRTTRADPREDVWIAPALFDPQINGFGGVDFQQDGIDVEQLQLSIRKLRAAGCGRFLLTLVTDEWSKLTRRLRHLIGLRRRSLELRDAIAGWHVEGPFLSSESGFHGAHNPAFMIDPTLKRIRELRGIVGSQPLLLTMAPERRGALEAIRLARRLGIMVSLGHTNASAECLAQAVKAGATGFTHLGNACPQMLDRHDNILWRVLDTPGLNVSLIADGIHVSPGLFRLVHRVLSGASIFYTTDAMAAAGSPPGRYTIGGIEVEVGEDGIVRQPGKTNFAGSSLRPIDGLFSAAKMLDQPWQKVWDGFSGRAAQFLGLNYGLHPGSPAVFCLLRFETDSADPSVQTVVNGKMIAGSISG